MLHVFPSVETCGDWYLFRQREVHQFRLPGLLDSDLLSLSFPLYVALAGQQDSFLSLPQRVVYSAFESVLLLLIFLRGSNALWVVVQVFWGIGFVEVISLA